MDKHILAIGCSYTIGHDNANQRVVRDFVEDDKLSSWPSWLGKLTDRTCVNYGENGVGSFYMANKVYELVDKYKDKDFIVMVMWSGLHRYDMIKDDKWIHSGQGKFENFQRHHYEFEHDDQNAYYHTILNMLNVQNFLKQKNIKYLFLTHRDILSEFYQKYEKVSYLEENIDWNNFYFHDGFKGCMEWCTENGLELNDTKHPYKEGYRKYAEHLYDVFNGKLL